MKNVNTFFKAERKDSVQDPGRSLTLPGLSIDISEVLQSGNLDSLSDNMRKRMIFGKRQQLTDLTDLDYYASKIKHYETIFNQKINSEKKINDEEKEEVKTEVKKEEKKVEVETEVK